MAIKPEIVPAHTHTGMAGTDINHPPPLHEATHETGGSDELDNLAAAVITSGTLDGDRLPAISTTKKGAVPAVTPGTPSEYLRDTGDFEVVQQNEVASIHNTDVAVFDTVDLTELTDRYIPVQDDHKPGLVNSNISNNEAMNRVGINVNDPLATLDIAGIGTDDLQKVVDASANPRHKKDYLGNAQWNVSDGSNEVALMEFTTFENCPCFSMWTQSPEA
jgi:hypothetical protein